jgi:hypothetical protein
MAVRPAVFVRGPVMRRSFQPANAMTFWRKFIDDAGRQGTSKIGGQRAARPSPTTLI